MLSWWKASSCLAAWQCLHAKGALLTWAGSLGKPGSSSCVSRIFTYQVLLTRFSEFMWKALSPMRTTILDTTLEKARLSRYASVNNACWCNKLPSLRDDQETSWPATCSDRQSRCKDPVHNSIVPICLSRSPRPITKHNHLVAQRSADSLQRLARGSAWQRMLILGTLASSQAPLEKKTGWRGTQPCTHMRSWDWLGALLRTPQHRILRSIRVWQSDPRQHWPLASSQAESLLPMPDADDCLVLVGNSSEKFWVKKEARILTLMERKAGLNGLAS